MASETWDEVITRYQEIYLRSRYADNAKGILNLIPRIKDNPVFAGVEPGASLTALCLKIPDHKVKIFFWCEKYGEEYSISIQDNSEEKWTTINDAQIISVLEQNIREISRK